MIRYRVFYLFILLLQYISNVECGRMPPVTEFSISNITTNVKEWDTDLAIMFYSPLCQYCKQLAPSWEHISYLVDKDYSQIFNLVRAIEGMTSNGQSLTDILEGIELIANSISPNSGQGVLNAIEKYGNQSRAADVTPVKSSITTKGRKLFDSPLPLKDETNTK